MQKPVTFFRQVLSLCEYPELLEHPATADIYPPDAIEVRYLAERRWTHHCKGCCLWCLLAACQCLQRAGPLCAAVCCTAGDACRPANVHHLL